MELLYIIHHKSNKKIQFLLFTLIVTVASDLQSDANYYQDF